jgi:hypothetical protein
MLSWHVTYYILINFNYWQKGANKIKQIKPNTTTTTIYINNVILYKQYEQFEHTVHFND